MRRIALLPLVLIGVNSLVGCKKDTPTPAPSTPLTTSLSLETISPVAGTMVSYSLVLDATLKYSLADEQQSSQGFEVFAQYQSTVPGMTFGGSTVVTLPNRSGKVTVSAPLSMVWNDTQLAHPITVFFYLAKKDSNGSSKVIAKSSPVVYLD